MAQNFERLTLFFQKHRNVSRKEIESIYPYLVLQKLKKLSFLVREGEGTEYIYFVNKGILRAFYMKDLKEITTWFTFENDLAACFSAVVRKEPSQESLQAMVDTEVIAINYHGFKLMASSSISMSNLLIQLFEEAYIRLDNRASFIQHSSAKIKLMNLIQYESHILEKIPHHYVASYLAITPETLSRLLQEIFKKK